MAGIVALIAVALIVLVALLWTPVKAFLALRRATDEAARKPHRAKLREWFRVAGLVLIAFALLSRASTSAAPPDGLPLSYYDMATAAIGVVLMGISYLYLRDPVD